MSAVRKGKFEHWKTEGAKEPFRWRLKASNGRIICQSEGYKSLRACLNGMEAVKNVAETADVVEVAA